MARMATLLMIGDVRNAEKCQDLHLHGSRVPEWLLSDQDLDAVGATRLTTRPDLMVIGTTSQVADELDGCKQRGQYGRRRGMLSAGHQTHPVKVLIVEVGYVSDTKYEEKLKDKMAQHGKLLAALSNAGFEASVLPVILGNTGGVFHSNLTSMQALGISHDRSLHLIRTLSKQATDYMQAMIDLRRCLEKRQPP